MAIPSGMYFVRVNQPGYGPKIIAALLSDLGPLSQAVGPFTDLRTQGCQFTGSGAPSASTLLAGNYDPTIPGSGYLANVDFYLDNSNPSSPAYYACTTGGSDATSQWQKISGGGSNGNWNYRGLWSAAVATGPNPYNIFDVVQFGSGTSAGGYLSTIAGNTNQPDTGIGWIQVYTSVGAWL